MSLRFRVVRVSLCLLSLNFLVGNIARADRLELVSRALPELVSDTAGQGGTLLAASADARWTVFASSAPNLVSGQIDTNQVDDVFLYDRDNGSVTLVSHLPGSAAATGNGLSGTSAVISADGRYVAFLSQAKNLISGLPGQPRRIVATVVQTECPLSTLVKEGLEQPSRPLTSKIPAAQNNSSILS